MNAMRPSISRFSTLLHKKPFPTPSPGPHLPPGILVDEEISPVYDSKYFYPAKPGEVLADRIRLWSRLAGACLRQYGSHVICKGSLYISVQFEALAVFNIHIGILKSQRPWWR
jgi:hypothetical protein